MKRLTIGLILVISLSGCSFVDEAKGAVSDGLNSYENVTSEISEIEAKYTETKEKVVETIDDVNTAIDKVQEAKDAIEKVTE